MSLIWRAGGRHGCSRHGREPTLQISASLCFTAPATSPVTGTMDPSKLRVEVRRAFVLWLRVDGTRGAVWSTVNRVQVEIEAGILALHLPAPPRHPSTSKHTADVPVARGGTVDDNVATKHGGDCAGSEAREVARGKGDGVRLVGAVQLDCHLALDNVGRRVAWQQWCGISGVSKPLRGRGRQLEP